MYWKLPRVRALIEKYSLKPAKFDGCAIGLKSANGVLIRKPWLIMTNCEAIVRRIGGHLCTGNHEREGCRGRSAVRSASYMWVSGDVIHKAVKEEN